MFLSAPSWLERGEQLSWLGKKEHLDSSSDVFDTVMVTKDLLTLSLTLVYERRIKTRRFYRKQAKSLKTLYYIYKQIIEYLK